MKHENLDMASIADRALEREMALVDSAVEMVATRHAVRMQLGGLAFGDALLDHARRVGARRGIRVTPHWGVGEEGLALVFEPAAEPSVAYGDEQAAQPGEAPGEGSHA
jgi:hypothetical protein